MTVAADGVRRHRRRRRAHLHGTYGQPRWSRPARGDSGGDGGDAADGPTGWRSEGTFTLTRDGLVIDKAVLSNGPPDRPLSVAGSLTLDFRQDAVVRGDGGGAPARSRPHASAAGPSAAGRGVGGGRQPRRLAGRSFRSRRSRAASASACRRSSSAARVIQDVGFDAPRRPRAAGRSASSRAACRGRRRSRRRPADHRREVRLRRRRASRRRPAGDLRRVVARRRPGRAPGACWRLRYLRPRRDRAPAASRVDQIDARIGDADDHRPLRLERDRRKDHRARSRRRSRGRPHRLRPGQGARRTARRPQPHRRRRARRQLQPSSSRPTRSPSRT